MKFIRVSSYSRVFLLLTALITLIITTSSCQPRLSADERLALAAVKAIQEELLAPKSIRLYSVIIMAGEETKRNVYVSYAATNRAGRLFDSDAVVTFENDKVRWVFLENTNEEIHQASSENRKAAGILMMALTRSRLGESGNAKINSDKLQKLAAK